MVVYDDGEGEPEGIFYHSTDDPEGCILEAKRRREIQAYIEDSDLGKLSQDRGSAVNDCIIPVPNTVDVLGVLKGEVEFAPTLKRLGDFTDEDHRRSFTFFADWITIVESER
jgi:hypothetical protein